MEYLLILLLFLAVALCLEWKYRIHLYHSRKERIIIPFFFFLVGSAWDSLAVLRGHWSFSGRGLVGVTLGALPLEEYLFMLIIPFFILTSYKVLEKKFHKKR